MTATAADRNRLNTIIAGQHYNPAQWDSDFNKWQRMAKQNLKQPGKYKEEDLEARAEDLCIRRFGAIYSDLKEYFRDYDLPVINLLSALVNFFLSSGNFYDNSDFTMTDNEILSSIRMAVREYADEHLKAFGVDTTKPAEQQTYYKAPVKYKPFYEMPVDKVNGNLFELLHSPDMKMKYNIIPAGQDPVYVTAQLQYPYHSDPVKQQEIFDGITLLRNLSYSVDVLQAACQLYQPDKEIEFSAADVYRVLETRYKETHGQVPTTSEKDIDDILSIWYSLTIAIGAEQQAEKWNKIEDPETVKEKFTRENFFRVLPVEMSKATYIRRPEGSDQLQLTEKRTYKFNAGGRIICPPLLDYSKNVSGQIATFDDFLLNSPGKFSKLSKTINTHLLDYIDAMKNRKRSNKILYTTLAHEIGYFRQDDPEDPKPIPWKDKQTLRRIVKDYLFSFIKQGFIYSFGEYPLTSKSKDGVIITLTEQDQDVKTKRKSNCNTD